jgi:hypothetical protein
MNQIDAVEKATQDDARWFKKHAGRMYRIRRRFPGEPSEAAPSRQGWTIVKQLAPGVRTRMFIAAPLGFVPYDTDDNIGALMGFALSHPNDPGRSRESKELAQRSFLSLSPATSAQ